MEWQPIETAPKDGSFVVRPLSLATATVSASVLESRYWRHEAEHRPAVLRDTDIGAAVD